MSRFIFCMTNYMYINVALVSLLIGSYRYKIMQLIDQRLSDGQYEHTNGKGLKEVNGALEQVVEHLLVQVLAGPSTWQRDVEIDC